MSKQAAPFGLAIALIAFVAVVADGEPNENTRVFSSCDLDASFEYPAEWGCPVVTDHRTDPRKAELLGGAGLDWVLRFGNLAHRPFYVELRVGEITPDILMRIVVYEGWSDTTSFSELRTQVEQGASLMIDGNSAKVDEEYFEPGGAAHQTTAWFCGNRFYELVVSADVRDFKVKYGRPLGITRLHQLNPDDAKLGEFVGSVNRLVEGFKCEG